MKILVIGGNGTIGKPVVNHFSKTDEVIVAGRNSGDIVLDIANTASIKKALDQLGKLDAIVCIAGEAKWDDFENLSEQDYYIGIKSKLMGQVNLVRIGQDYINENGSITLSTGILADDPVIKTTSAAMVNGAIHSFVQAVSLELKGFPRVNAVSLGMVDDAYEKYKNYFPGHNPIPMNKVIKAYERSVKGQGNGDVIRYYE
jgi:NAD(P)-dependent dehydrogenase (short-subunit alcohol dehydrogenase family)